MKKYVLILGIITISYLSSFAQPDHGKWKQKRENIEAEKIAYITQQLQLTPSEAQVFWPIYNEFKSKRDAILKDKITGQCQVRNADTEEITDKQATEISDNMIINEQKVVDLRKEYHAKFKTVLTPKKLLRLYQTEKEFKRKLLKEIKNR